MKPVFINISRLFEKWRKSISIDAGLEWRENSVTENKAVRADGGVRGTVSSELSPAPGLYLGSFRAPNMIRRKIRFIFDLSLCE